MAETAERHSADELNFRRKRIILIAMDGSKHSEYAMNWYVENLHKKTDQVIIVYCTEHFHLPSTSLVGTSDHDVDALYHAHMEENKQLFRHIEEIATKHKVTHTVEHLHGYPGPSIVKAAGEHKAGMIICGSRGKGLFRRTIMGSNSDYILHHAHIPVIVVKHEDEVKKLKAERQDSNKSTHSVKSERQRVDSTSSSKSVKSH